MVQTQEKGNRDENPPVAVTNFDDPGDSWTHPEVDRKRFVDILDSGALEPILPPVVRVVEQPNRPFWSGSRMPGVGIYAN